MHLLRRVGSSLLRRCFSIQKKADKSVKTHLHTLQSATQSEELQTQTQSHEQITHLMLYVQFSPLVPLSSIILFSWLDPYSSTMRLGLNMMQMYTSALMCYNTHLVPEHQKYFLPFATFIAALNLVPESFAIVSPYLMIGANLLFPYIDRKELELEEESKEESVKTLLKVHGIIYFFLVFVSLMRLKIFLETNAMEKQLDNLDRQNKQFYGIPLSQNS